MTDQVEDFFTALGQRGYEPLLQHSSGSIRFDLLDGGVPDHWQVSVDRGKVTVGREEAAADAVVTQDRSVLADVILGKQNLLNAAMLGLVGVSGDVEKVVSFQRLFGHHPLTTTTQTARR
jgi:putative sterol carrier protein